MEKIVAVQAEFYIMLSKAFNKLCSKYTVKQNQKKKLHTE